MKRVTVRTLALMVELLLAVVALQCLPSAKPPRAGAVWLAGDSEVNTPTPSEVNDCTIET
ncbi:MAG: hypothetical protein ABFE13_04195 [Phycisphaerales bacterium]